MRIRREAPMVYEKQHIIRELTEYLQVDGELFILTEDGVNIEVRHQIQQQFPYSIQYTVLSTSHMKTLENMEEVIKFMYYNGCRTKTTILILGGIQLKEFGGFLANSYYCGIPYVYIPVGIEAQKNFKSSFCGMDLQTVPNILGCSYAPSMVFLDSSLSI